MHRSRLACLVIDCKTDDFDRDIAFWGAALGHAGRRSEEPEFRHYGDLDVPADQPKVLLQQVDHPSRVHLDIETDDIDAEAVRLEELGAKRIARVRGWWVMEAPSGHRFCVVPPQRPDFPDGAAEWP